MINLRSKNYRLTGNQDYTVAGFWVNGVDSTATVNPNEYIGFHEEREGHKYLHTTYFDGDWKFDDEKKYLQISIGDTFGHPCGVLLTTAKTDWRITKLTDRELHINTDYKGKSYVLHLSKKKA